jgi:PAS domain S-box-containing protein
MDAIHPDDHKSVTACYEQALKGEKYDQEYRIIRGEGEIVWIHDRGNLTYDAKGWPLHLVGIAEDVTHRRTSEDDLRTERERLRLAYEAGTVGTWDWDVVRDEEHCSREYFMLYGLPPEPGLSSFDSWSQRVHPDDQDEAMKQALKAIDSGDTYECEYRVTWPDGSVHWLASRGKVYRDERGTAVRMIGVNVDVSDQKMVEATLRDHEEQLKKIVSERTLELEQANAYLVREIEERRKAEVSLRQSETHLQSLFAGIDDALYVHDRCVVTSLNAKRQRMSDTASSARCSTRRSSKALVFLREASPTILTIY